VGGVPWVGVVGWGGKKQVACWCGHGAYLEAATAGREVKSQ